MQPKDAKWVKDQYGNQRWEKDPFPIRNENQLPGEWDDQYKKWVNQPHDPQGRRDELQGLQGQLDPLDYQQGMDYADEQELRDTDSKAWYQKYFLDRYAKFITEVKQLGEYMLSQGYPMDDIEPYAKKYLSERYGDILDHQVIDEIIAPNAVSHFMEPINESMRNLYYYPGDPQYTEGAPPIHGEGESSNYWGGDSEKWTQLNPGMNELFDWFNKLVPPGEKGPPPEYRPNDPRWSNRLRLLSEGTTARTAKIPEEGWERDPLPPLMQPNEHGQTTLYHFAHPKWRDSNLANGLHPSAREALWEPEQQYPGVYMTESRQDEELEDPTNPYDLYQVDVSGLPLAYDDFWHAPAWIHPNPIPAERVKLLRKADEGTTAKTAADKACERCGNPVRPGSSMLPAFQEQYCETCRAQVAKEKNLPWTQEGVKPDWLYGDKTSMAERSGDSQLDALIEEFKAGEYDRDGEMREVEGLRDPEAAFSFCATLAEDFADFASQRGVQANAPWDEPAMKQFPWGQERRPSTPEDFGLQDRAVPGEDNHATTIVQMPSGTYSVDWTAAQYGYTEFPMVQKLDESGGWQREWVAAFERPWGYENINPEHGEVPPRVFHVAPSHSREDILTNGLDATGRTHNLGFGWDKWNAETGVHGDPDEPDSDYEYRPEGIYTFNDYPSATQYAQPDYDIWEINTQHPSMQGIDIIRDPSIAHNWGRDDYRGHVFEHVPKDAVRRVEPGEHLASDWMGDAYPGEDHTEEKTIDRDWTALQFEEHPREKVDTHNWVCTGDYVLVSDDDVEDMFARMGHHLDNAPIAYGTVDVYYNYEMMFSIERSNVASHLIQKALKKYAKDNQLKFEGLLSKDGSMFMEKEAASWVTAEYPGVGRGNPEKLWGLHDYGDDIPVNFYGEQNDPWYGDERPKGEMICHECGYIADSFGDFLVHENREHNDGLGIPENPHPVVDLDEPMPAHFNTNPDTRTDQTINRQASGVSLKTYGNCPYCNDGTRGQAAGNKSRYFKAGWYKCPKCARQFDPLQETDLHLGDKVRLLKEQLPHMQTVNKGAEGTIENMSQNPHNGLWLYLVSFGLAAPIQSEPNALDIGGRDILEGGAITQDMIDAINRGEATLPHPQAGNTEYKNWFGRNDLEQIEPHIPEWGFSDREPGDTIFPSNWHGSAYRSAKFPIIPAPIPFVFDIEKDQIHTGQPGHKHKDIKPSDKLTVNVVEGLYLPDGKLQFRSESTMPYSVRYLIRLWYTLFPELQVKNVEKLVKDKKYKLAK